MGRRGCRLRSQSGMHPQLWVGATEQIIWMGTQQDGRRRESPAGRHHRRTPRSCMPGLLQPAQASNWAERRETARRVNLPKCHAPQAQCPEVRCIPPGRDVRCQQLRQCPRTRPQVLSVVQWFPVLLRRITRGPMHHYHLYHFLLAQIPTILETLLT